MNTPAPTLTVSELARRVGVPVSTVRYYERRKLLAPKARSSGNYRLYSDASVERLRFIVAAKGAGFTLGDIQALLDFSDGAAAPCHDVQTLIEQRLASVAEQTKRLRQVKGALNGWLEACKEAENNRRCEVLDGLKKGRSSRSNGVSKKKNNNSRKPA